MKLQRRLRAARRHEAKMQARAQRQEQQEWRNQAMALRRENNLCACPDGDEVKTYLTQEESRGDVSEPPPCETCGLERLRIKAVHTPGYTPLGDLLQNLR